MVLAYEEVIEFIAAGSTPESVATFQPSEAARARVEDLIRRQKSESLNPDEATELNHYLEIEHLMRLAKARARHRLMAG